MCVCVCWEGLQEARRRAGLRRGGTEGTYPVRQGSVDGREEPLGRVRAGPPAGVGGGGLLGQRGAQPAPHLAQQPGLHEAHLGAVAGAGIGGSVAAQRDAAAGPGEGFGGSPRGWLLLLKHGDPVLRREEEGGKRPLVG